MSFLSVCPVIIHESRHNIVKKGHEAIAELIHDHFDNIMTKFIVNN